MSKIKPGIYRHYKGGEYEFVALAIQSEDKSDLVIYRSLKDGKIWARPYDIWSQKVEVEGKKQERFLWLRDSEEDSFEGKYKRALADYQNLLKQSQKEKAEFVKYALDDFLQDLLPVYDHLQMSLSSLPENEQDSAWVKGVEYVLKQFKDLLSARGVEQIKVVGEDFDHNLMEAVEGEGEVVDKEIRPGYTLHGKVIRAAKVSVKEK